MDDDETVLTVREVTPVNDAVASMCRWGGLLVGISLLAYVAMLV
jgi:hypothetical protein